MSTAATNITTTTTTTATTTTVTTPTLRGIRGGRGSSRGSRRGGGGDSGGGFEGGSGEREGNWRVSSRVAGRSIWAEKLKKNSGPTQPEKFWSLRPPRKTGLGRSVGTTNLSLRMDSLRGARKVSRKIEWRP